MSFERRIGEGRGVDAAALDVFARVAAWGARPAAGRIRRLVGRRLAPGQRVVDVGSGPGTIPLQLQQWFPACRFIGLDVSLPMLQRADRCNRRSGAPLSLVAGDGECLPFGHKALDGILCFFALHHMDRPECYLKEADRVLRPGGFLLLIDFRRDMPRGLFRVLNLLWQGCFGLTAGRFGFRDSVRSAWRPDEIAAVLQRGGIRRFRVASNPVELWITTTS
jgi:ubiquinone/menaquinone biosynthesis C-methylase UbiE